MEDYFAQPEEPLQEDTRPQYHYQGSAYDWLNAGRPLIPGGRSRYHAREHGKGGLDSEWVFIGPIGLFGPISQSVTAMRAASR